MVSFEELAVLGLSAGQVKVYQALLQLGSAGINSIQEKTALERRAIYDTLNKLIEKGYVSYTLEGGKRHFQTTGPLFVRDQLEQKRKELEAMQQKLPDLSELFESERPDIRAEVYRGNDAMKALLEESLQHDAIYWMGGNSGVETCSREMNLWFKRWTTKRIEAGQTMFDLVDKGTHLEEYLPGDLEKHKRDLYKRCELPENLTSPMVLIMFGNKVAQVLWSKQSFAFVLESEEISQSFMKYFNLFWKDPW